MRYMKLSHWETAMPSCFFTACGSKLVLCGTLMALLAPFKAMVKVLLHTTRTVVGVAVVAARPGLFVRVHDVQPGGEGLGRFLDRTAHAAMFDPVPDPVVEGIGDGLEEGFDHADGQGHAPVASDGQGHQHGDDKMHHAIAGDLEREAPHGSGEIDDHLRKRMLAVAESFKWG